MKKVILLTDKTKESGKAIAILLESGITLEILNANSESGQALIEAGYSAPTAFTTEGICIGLEEIDVIIGKTCNEPS